MPMSVQLCTCGAVCDYLFFITFIVSFLTSSCGISLLTADSICEILVLGPCMRSLLSHFISIPMLFTILIYIPLSTRPLLLHTLAHTSIHTTSIHTYVYIAHSVHTHVIAVECRSFNLSPSLGSNIRSSKQFKAIRLHGISPCDAELRLEQPSKATER
jgi:hypothetical protein